MTDAPPDRIYIDRGPKGGWMKRFERMPDTEHVYILATPRPMSEAPRDGTKVLAWWPDFMCWISTYWADDEYYVGWNCALLDPDIEGDTPPTHFIPHLQDPT